MLLVVCIFLDLINARNMEYIKNECTIYMQCLHSSCMKFLSVCMFLSHSIEQRLLHSGTHQIFVAGELNTKFFTP